MPDKKYLIEIPDMPEGSGVWDADRWERNKDLFMKDNPGAKVFEIGAYDPEDSQEHDQIMLSFEDEEKSGVWDNARWERNKDLFMQDNPDAVVNRVRYVDYWGQKAEENRARKKELMQPDEARNATLAELGYYDDITGGQVDFSFNAPSTIGLKPLSSAVKENAVGETEYLDPKVQEFFAKDTAETDRQAEIAKLDSEYEQNPAVIEYRKMLAERQAEQAAYADKRVEAIKAEIENIDSFKAARGAALKRNMSEEIPFQPLYETVTGKEAESGEENEKLEKYLTALKFYEKANDIREHAGKGFVNGVPLTKADKYKSLAYGAGDTFKGMALDKATQSDLEAYNEIGGILSNLEKKLGNLKEENITPEVLEKNLSKEDMELILSFFEYNSTLADAKKDMSKWYKGGQIFAESVPFMLEFLVTGGLYEGTSKAGSNLAKKGLTKALAGLIYKMGAKRAGAYVMKGGRALAGAALGTLARTLVSPGTYGRMAEATVEIDDNGHLHRGKNAAKSFVDAYIENLSEISGGLIGKGLGILGKGAGAVLAKTPLAKYGQMLGDTRLMQFVAKSWKAAAPKMAQLGFHGFPEEIGEEFIGNAIREITIQPGALKEMTEDDNFGAMIIGFAPTTLFGAGVGAVNVAAVNVKAASLGKSIKEMFSHAYGQENIDHMMNSMQSAENAEQMQQAVKPIAKAIRQAEAEGKITSEQADYEMETLYEYAGYMASNKALIFGQKALDRQLTDARAAQYEQKFGKFYQESENGEKSVQIAKLNNGSTVFVVSAPEADGQVSIVDATTGKHGFANIADIATQEVEVEGEKKTESMSRTTSLDEFINERIAMERQTSEQNRMLRERQAQIDALKKQITPGMKINLGTEGSPIIMFAKGTNSAGVVVVDQNGGQSTLGWEQVADYMGQPIRVKTDQEISDDMVAAKVAEWAERRKASRTASPAVQAAAENASAETANVVAEEEKHIPMNEDGSVNEVAFWEQDPEGFAKWNDEQNKDGGQDTLQQIAMTKIELTALLDEQVAAQNTSNPTLRKAAKAEAARLAERLARIDALERSYMETLQEEKKQVEQTKARPTAEMSEQDLETMDQQYQNIFGKTKVRAERVRVMQEYLDKISEGSTPVVLLTAQDYAERLAQEGVSEEMIAKVTAQMQQGKVAGFMAKGKTFVMYETIPAVDEARITYVHERQHELNKQDPTYIKAMVDAVHRMGGRKKMLKILEAFVGKKAMNAYKDLGVRGLADEIICRAMEIAYSNADFSVALQQLGVPQEVINIIEQIDNEQRGNRSLAHARRRGGRTSHADLSGRENTGENGRDNRQVSGGVLGEQGSGSARSGERGIEDRGAGEPGTEVDSEEIPLRVVTPEEDLPEANLSEETKAELAEKGLVMEGGAIMSNEYADLKHEAGYATPNERDIDTDDVRFSVVTKDAWKANYLKHPEAEVRVANQLDLLAQRMVANEFVNSVISHGEHKYGKAEKGSFAGPLRTNDEYVVTFDMDTTCPRTFQFLEYVKKIERRVGRPLTQVELIQLTEMMRMYGQMIPCVYCYAENKRQALKESYSVFMNARYNVLKAKTDEEAIEYMYGRKANATGTNPDEVLTEAAAKVFRQWRAEAGKAYNPTMPVLYRQYMNDRDSILSLLDFNLSLGKINTDMSDDAITKKIAADLRVTDVKASRVIGELVEEWKWDTIEGKEHDDFHRVDEDDMWVNEQALAVWRDMTSYAKSSSSAKTVVRYTPYTDELKKLSQEQRDHINGMGGVRMHSTNDFRIDYVFDYFQFMADMAANKMLGHTYTKSPEFVRIFGNSGYKINMSIAAYQDADGNVRPNVDEGFDWKEAQELRRFFPNAGVMLMATSDEQLQMALDSDWIDMCIPFHKSGLPKVVWYNMRLWKDYEPVQKELFYNVTEMKQMLIEDGVEVPKGATKEHVTDIFNEHFNIIVLTDENGERIKPHFLPGPSKDKGVDIPGHYNDHQTYLDLCRQYGVKPRFKGVKVKDNSPEGQGRTVDITEHPSYMKVIKETARTDTPQTPVQFNFDEPSEALGGRTPIDYAFEELETRAMAESQIAGGKVGDIYNSLKQDQFGIVDQFMNTIIKHKKETGKDYPLDYLTPDSREWFMVQRKALEEAFQGVNEIPYHRNVYDEQGNLIEGIGLENARKAEEERIAAEEKAEKEAEKAAKKAARDAEKAAKKAEKEAEKAAKKAAKEAEKAAKKAAKKGAINLMDEAAKAVEEEVKMRFIGEQGAARLDAAVEAGSMMSNLAMARNMEKAGKDARAIKAATGWERGADSKWRYEQEDFVFKAKPGKKKTYKMTDLIHDMQLFTAYPELKDAKVKYTKLPKGQGGSLSYEDGKILIEVNEEFYREYNPVSKKAADDFIKNYPEIADRINAGTATEEDSRIFREVLGPVFMSNGKYADELGGRSIIVHEIQHAIQDIEGFAQGGSKEMIDLSDPVKRKQFDKLEKMVEAEEKAAEAKEYDAAKIIRGGINLRNMDEIERLLDEARIHRQTVVALKRMLDRFEELGVEGYTRLAGEVEARNAEARIDMTDEQRRQSLIEDTQDVATEDQIFILDNLMMNYDEMAGSVSFRTIEEIDEDYMKAVETGDLATAERLVAEAAERWGRNSKVRGEDYEVYSGQEAKPLRVMYHGTEDTGFTVFNTDPQGNNIGSHFGSRIAGEEFASRHDDRAKLYKVYLNITNPLNTFDWFGQDDAYPLVVAEEIIDAMPAGEARDKAQRLLDEMLKFPGMEWATGDLQTDEDNVTEYFLTNLEDHEAYYERLREIIILAGYDGLVYGNDLEDYDRENGRTNVDYIALYPEQIKSAEAITYDNDGNVIPLSERFQEENEDIRFSIIGEVGALRDKTSEGMTRLQNLETARQMEQDLNPDWTAKENEAALKIKMATGWERGAEGLWRYETEDIKIKPIMDWLFSKKKLTLGDIVEDGELLRLYPDLADIKLIKMKSKYDLHAVYYHKTNEIALPFGALKDDINEEWYWGKKRFEKDAVTMYDDIIHEVQHAIQRREGFARGGNEKMVHPEYRQQYNDLTKRLMTVADKYNSMTIGQRNEPDGVMLREYFNDLNRDRRKLLLGERGYTRLAGESEARNVEHRKDFTPEQRRNTLLASTEDVAREDMIFILDSIDQEEESSVRFRMANENQTIFVSNAAKAVEGINMGKAAPEQWLKTLEKNGGLKAGEDKWMGLSEWLKTTDKKSITKQELLDYVNEHMIQIEEQHYGEMTEERDVLGKEVKNELQRRFDSDRDYYRKEFTKENDETIEDWAYDNLMKQLKYKLHNAPFYVSEGKVYLDIDGEASFNELVRRLNIQNPQALNAIRPINETRLDYTTIGLNNLHEIALTVPTIESWNADDSIHFGDAGEGRAVAWIRFGETADENGNRILVIDEIQSKRHQDARDAANKRKWWLDKKVKEYKLAENEKPVTDEQRAAVESKLSESEKEELKALTEEMNTIPAAPFEKNWHELAMKRMLRYAAENGYDVVAWTKGEQQAERYNIGGVISEIKATKYPRGYEVVAFGNNGKVVHNEVFADKSAMAEVYGKEMSQRIIESVDALEPSETATINGDNLRIGGEGMKGFYDQILPKFMDKYGKKWGVKTEDIELPNLEGGLTMHSVPVTEEMKESVMEGQVMFRTVFGGNKGYVGYSMSKRAAEARREGRFPKGDFRKWYNITANALDLLVYNSIIDANEWHHTSMYGNRTTFYGWYEDTYADKYAENKKEVDALAREFVNARKEHAESQQQISKRLFANEIDPEQSFQEEKANNKAYHDKIDEISAKVDAIFNPVEPTGSEDDDLEFRVVTDQDLIDWFNDTAKVSAYRAVQINSQADIFSPMASSIRYKDNKNTAAGMMQIDEAVENPHLVAMKDGKPVLKKGENGGPDYATITFLDEDGGRTTAAYNPYGHCCVNSMMNDQFKRAYDRDELYVVRVSAPASEISSGYRAEMAKDAVGIHKWKTGPVGSKLPEAKRRQILLTRWMRNEEVMTWEAVAQDWIETLKGENIKVPFNVVPRKILNMLVDGGVKIVAPQSGMEVAIPKYEQWLADPVGYVGDTELPAHVKALNEQAKAKREIQETGDVSFRMKDDVKISGSELGSIAGDIFEALPEGRRSEITSRLNGNILGLQDAIMQIPTDLAVKEQWSDEDKATAKAVKDAVNAATGAGLTAAEALWALYNANNKATDLISEASRALVKRNLGFSPEAAERHEMEDDYIRFRTVRNDMIDMATDMYNYETALWTERLKESWLDMNQSVESLQKALEKGTGRGIEPWENVVLALNRLSSKSYADKKRYMRDFLEPMWDEVIRVMKLAGCKVQDVERYLMLKHGLERNEIFAARDAREYYRSMFDVVAERMEKQSHAQQVVALSEARQALADIDAKIANATGSALERLKEQRKQAEHDLRVAELVIRGDEQQNEQDLQDHYDAIAAGLDSKYQEFREKDYGGLTSMFMDVKEVKRSQYRSQEAYEKAVLENQKPKYTSVKKMEKAAQQEVDAFEAKVGTGELWSRINAATKETLRHQHESGMITDEQYDAVRDMFKYYVPLRGFADNTAEDMYSYYMSNSAGGFAKPIIAAKGRTTRAESPLGWIGTMAESGIQADNKNDAKMCLYYAVMNRPDQALATITDTWFEGRMENGRKVFRPVYPPKTDRALTADELRDHVAAWENDMKQKAANGMAYRGSLPVNLKGSVVFQDAKEKEEHIVRVKVAGKDYSIVINGNPRAAQAINGLLNPDANLGPVEEWIGAARRNLSALLTSYSPLFWVANFQRDLLSSTMRVSQADGALQALKYLNNRRHAWRVAAYVYTYESGKMGDGYYADLYREFAENGGITGYTSLTTNKEYERLFDSYARAISRPVSRFAKNVFNNFMQFGEAIEQVSRFAAYITAREAGKSIEEAVNAAKEVSVNFNRKGSAKPISLDELSKLRTKSGKELNIAQKAAAIILSAMPKWMKNLYFFFNASIQSISSQIKLSKNSPFTSAAWAGAYFGLSMAMATINYLISGGDDDEEYIDLPDYLRESTILVNVGDGYYFKWSIPQEMRPFYSWADLIVRKNMGKMPHKNLGLEMALATAQWLPVNPFESEDPLLSLVPDVASPLAEIYLNKTTFGSKVYNDMPFKSEEVVKEIPGYRKATAKTGKMYVDLAEFLNEVSGGDEVTKGWADFNPAKLEHLVEGYGGGIYDFTKMLVTFPGLLQSDDPMQIKDIPFVNKVLLSTDETNMYSHTNDAYNYYRNVADNAKRVESEYRASDDPARADAYRAEEDYRVYLLHKQYEDDFKDVKERLDKAVDEEEIAALRKEQNVLREMFLDDIAQGTDPDPAVQMTQDMKLYEKELREFLKPVTDADKERLARKKARDWKGMNRARKQRDSLRRLPEFKEAEQLRKDLKEMKKRLEELNTIETPAQRDSFLDSLQIDYDDFVKRMGTLK